MNLLQAFILGLVQGATEFIPISSSAHLVLVPWLAGWPEPGLAFDTTLHLGTLVAVVAYFWRDWVATLTPSVPPNFWGEVGEGEGGQGGIGVRAGLIIAGTIPAALLGFLFEDFFEALFSAPFWVAVLLLVTGSILTASERVGRRQREMTDLGWLDALVIGLAQGLAIAPGLSRSGATIAAGLWRGLKRDVAARFSFLLAAPIILGAGLLQLVKLTAAADVTGQVPLLVVGFLAAMISGYLSIKFLMAFLQQGRLYRFAVYCWAAGLAALAVIALGVR